MQDNPAMLNEGRPGCTCSKNSQIKQKCLTRKCWKKNKFCVCFKYQYFITHWWDLSSQLSVVFLPFMVGGYKTLFSIYPMFHKLLKRSQNSNFLLTFCVGQVYILILRCDYISPYEIIFFVEIVYVNLQNNEK